VLHLIILPECLPGNATEFQLGMCAVCGPHGFCIIDVCVEHKIRGPGRESHHGGAGLGLKVGSNGAAA
jgi:hypothetical protein